MAPQISARAWAAHKRALVFDGHAHALDREFYHGGSMGTRKPYGQWDLPRAREGGEGAFFFSVFIPEEYYPGRFETKLAFRRVDDALRQLQMNSDQVALALNADDVEGSRSEVQALSLFFGHKRNLRRFRDGAWRGMRLLAIGDSDSPPDVVVVPGLVAEVPNAPKTGL